MAKPRAIADLSADDSFAEAAARIVSMRVDELAEHADGVLDTEDIEPVHDMRVATRRLRAALEVFEPCFPRKLHRLSLREVKRLADGLGERRDRDVAILALRDFSGRIGPPDRPGVSSLIERLRGEQAEANAGLAPLVEPERLTALRARIEEMIEAARGSRGGSAHDGASP